MKSLALLAAAAVVAAPALAHADDDPPRPRAPASTAFSTCYAEPAPQLFLSDGRPVTVIRDGDQEWRAHRASVKLGLTIGGLALGALGIGVMVAALGDMNRCHDYFGLCNLGDTYLAVLGGAAAAGGSAMLIVGSALPSVREGVPWAPRPVLAVGPGSARLTVAF